MQIKRRVPALNIDGRAIPGRFEEKLEQATLVKKNKSGAFIQLNNGDTIYRKNRDIIELKASNEQSN